MVEKILSPYSPIKVQSKSNQHGIFYFWKLNRHIGKFHCYLLSSLSLFLLPFPFLLSFFICVGNFLCGFSARIFPPSLYSYIFIFLNSLFLSVFLFCCLVAKSSLTLCNPMDGSPPSSSVHGISQTGILEQVAISFCRGFSQPRDWTRVFCFGRQILSCWATREFLVEF